MERRLSLKEAQAELGISERTIHRWIKSGKLKSYKPGRDHQIPESAIHKVIEESEVYPKSQASLWPEELPERRDYDFRGARDGLDRFCEHWQRRLKDKDLSRQVFDELGVTINTWMPFLVTTLAAEWNKLAASGDDFHEASVVWPAVERLERLFDDLHEAVSEVYGDDAEAQERREMMKDLTRQIA